MLLSMLSRPCARAAYLFVVQTKRSDMRQGSMQRRKERDSERVGCVKGWMRGSSFVATGICGRERGIRGREWTCVATDRRMEGRLRWFIYYIPVFTVS